MEKVIISKVGKKFDKSDGKKKLDKKNFKYDKKKIDKGIDGEKEVNTNDRFSIDKPEFNYSDERDSCKS